MIDAGAASNVFLRGAVGSTVYLAELTIPRGTVEGPSSGGSTFSIYTETLTLSGTDTVTLNMIRPAEFRIGHENTGTATTNGLFINSTKGVSVTGSYALTILPIATALSKNIQIGDVWDSTNDSSYPIYYSTRWHPVSPGFAVTIGDTSVEKILVNNSGMDATFFVDTGSTHIGINYALSLVLGVGTTGTSIINVAGSYRSNGRSLTLGQALSSAVVAIAGDITLLNTNSINLGAGALFLNRNAVLDAAGVSTFVIGAAGTGGNVTFAGTLTSDISPAHSIDLYAQGVTFSAPSPLPLLSIDISGRFYADQTAILTLPAPVEADGGFIQSSRNTATSATNRLTGNITVNPASSISLNANTTLFANTVFGGPSTGTATNITLPAIITTGADKFDFTARASGNITMGGNPAGNDTKTDISTAGGNITLVGNITNNTNASGMARSLRLDVAASPVVTAAIQIISGATNVDVDTLMLAGTATFVYSSVASPLANAGNLPHVTLEDNANITLTGYTTTPAYSVMKQAGSKTLTLGANAHFDLDRFSWRGANSAVTGFDLDTDTNALQAAADSKITIRGGRGNGTATAASTTTQEYNIRVTPELGTTINKFGNLIIDNGYALLGTPIYVRGDLTLASAMGTGSNFPNGGRLDVNKDADDGSDTQRPRNPNKITVGGNWTQWQDDIGTDPADHLNRNDDPFLPRYGTVEFTGETRSTVEIRGNTTWSTFEAYRQSTTAGPAVIKFENYPMVHKVERFFFIKSDSFLTEGERLVVTRLEGDWKAPDHHTPPTLPFAPQINLHGDADEQTSFWFLINTGDFTLGGPGSSAQYNPGEPDTFSQNFEVYHNWAKAAILVSRNAKQQYADPYSPRPPTNKGYYNVNWIISVTFYYSFTEDSDGNGRIDRIRAQAAVLDTVDTEESQFSAFEVYVDGYEVDTNRGVNGFSRVPSTENTSIYIYLKEKDYPDTGAVPFWTVMANQSLKINNELLEVGGDFEPVDLSPPRIAYTLAVAGRSEIYVRFSEPVSGFQPVGAVSFGTRSFPYNRIEAMQDGVPVPYTLPGASATEFVLFLDAALPADVLVNGMTFDPDVFRDVTDKTSLGAGVYFPPPPPVLQGVMPLPFYPRTYDYSSYIKAQNGGGLSPHVPEDLYNNSPGYAGGNVKVPTNPYHFEGGGASPPRRASDLLLMVPYDAERRPDEGANPYLSVWLDMVSDGASPNFDPDDPDQTVGRASTYGGWERLRPGIWELVFRSAAGLPVSDGFNTPAGIRMYMSPVQSFDGFSIGSRITPADIMGHMNNTVGVLMPDAEPPPVPGHDAADLPVNIRDLSYFFGARSTEEATGLPKFAAGTKVYVKDRDGFEQLYGPSWPLPDAAFRSTLPMREFFFEFNSQSTTNFNPGLGPLFGLRLASKYPPAPGGAYTFVFPDTEVNWWDLDETHLNVLDKPYLHKYVRPFNVIVDGFIAQRSDVTILNNVIDPTKGERTVLTYRLARQGRVTIQVSTLDGTIVRHLERSVKAASASDEFYSVEWDGKNAAGRPVARGMYFIRIVAPEIDEIRKVMVVK